MSLRIQALQERVLSGEADVFVLMPGASLTWLTGHAFDAHERLFLLFVPGDGEPCAVLPALEQDNWAASVPDVDRLFPWEDKDGPEAALAEACARFSAASKVAIEPLGLRYREYSLLAQHMTGVEFVDGSPTITALRRRKDDDEAAYIRRAAEIAEAALEETLATVKPGVTEREIAAGLSSRLLAKGGEGISFGPIVLGGPKSALPHGVPDERPLGEGHQLGGLGLGGLLAGEDGGDGAPGALGRPLAGGAALRLGGAPRPSLTAGRAASPLS